MGEFPRHFCSRWHLFEEGLGVKVGFPGQGRPVDRCVVMEILGVLEELVEYFELLHKGTFWSKEDSEEDAGMVHHLNKDILSVGAFGFGLVSLALLAQSPGW
jgi:hypothetical protein